MARAYSPKASALPAALHPDITEVVQYGRGEGSPLALSAPLRRVALRRLKTGGASLLFYIIRRGFVNQRRKGQGTGGGLFAPDRPITREEAAVLLRRAADYLGRETATSSNLAECNDYDGISPWADDSLYWATEIRLIDWAPGGLMAPGETISPAEFSGILERFV